jgi:acyl dehydratase
VEVDAARALAYAAATNDDNPAYAHGDVLPPLFGVVPAWSAFLAAVDDLVPEESLPMLLHAGHDMTFHRPLVPGTSVTSTARLAGVRDARVGTWMSLAIRTVDPAGELLVEQVATLFVRGLEAGGTGGEPMPSHTFAAAGRTPEAHVADVAGRIDFDQTFRYAEASLDRNAIHLDEAVAKAAGLPGIIVHGMCTMATCGRCVVDAVAGRDPRRLRRLAVRFSQPVMPGTDVVTSIYRSEGGEAAGLAASVYAFEATSGGARVVKDGLAVLAP